MVGVGVHVEQARAAGGEGRADGVDRRGVAALGDVGDGEQASRVEHEAPGVEHVRAADLERRLEHDDVEVDRAPRRCRRSPALAPKATWTVPRIFSSSSTLPVSVARSLVPTPSSARLVPALAVRDSARRPGRRRRQPTVADGQPRRLLGQPDRRQRRGDERALAAGRRDEPLAAGQVAERAGARSGRRRRRCRRGRSGRGAGRPARTGEVRLVGVVEQRRHRAAALAQRTEVDRHHAREHVLGDARHRRAAGAGVGRALRACVCESDLLVGAMNTSAAASAAAIGGGGSVPSVARSSITASTASAPAASRLGAQRLAQGVAWRGRRPPARPRPRARPGTR